MAQAPSAEPAFVPDYAEDESRTEHARQRIVAERQRVSPARAQDFWTLPGFCWGARVSTSFGDLPVQALRVRDPVRTSSGSFRPVAWIDEVKLDDGFLDGFPDAQPIAIAAGALGSGRPAGDLTLSPHQRVAVGDSAFRPEFRMARDLTDRPGILRRPQTPLRYFMFHLGEPAQVMVEGVWVSVAP